MHLAVFGFGSVGRALCAQANSVGIRISAIADSSGVLISSAAEGLSAADLNAARVFKEQKKGSLSNMPLNDKLKVVNQTEAVEWIAKKHKVNVLADCSAHDDPNTYLLPAQNKNIPVVLANKKPLTGKIEDFRSLTADRSLIRFESTVGAGLPVIMTLRRLLDTNDPIVSIEGQLSGTLGFILSALEQDEPFSKIVASAKQQGYTEPDPRDDLSGLDVARKALIMARCNGSNLDLSSFEVEALYPAHMADIPVDEFMKKLNTLDASVKETVKECKDKGKKLRYVATVTPKGINVGLTQVEATSPLASLQGTDNLVSFKTQYYSGNPLVIRGPGAGINVTAAGVLSDIMDLYGSNIKARWGL